MSHALPTRATLGWQYYNCHPNYLAPGEYTRGTVWCEKPLPAVYSRRAK